VTVGVGRRK